MVTATAFFASSVRGWFACLLAQPAVASFSRLLPPQAALVVAEDDSLRAAISCLLSTIRLPCATAAPAHLAVLCCCSCTDLQGLTEQQTRECVKAAAIKLEYPGTLGPTAAAAGGAAAATGAITADAGTAGREVKLEGAAAATNDLASLHAKEMQAGHMSGLGRAEEYLGRKMTGPDGGLGFVEQMCIILFVAGAVWFGYTRLQRFRLSRAKGHSRSE